MKAYVRVIYSSEGGRPSVVEEAFTNKGFSRVKNTSIFKVDVEGDEELNSKLDDLHEYLRGLEVEFHLPGIPASRVEKESDMDYRERLEKWRVLGIDVDNLAAILKDDPDAFKKAALEAMRARIERMAKEREMQIREQEAKARLEQVKKRVVEEIETSDGISFHELNSMVDIDADLLSGILDSLMDKEQIVAEQRGAKVVFASPG